MGRVFLWLRCVMLASLGVAMLPSHLSREYSSEFLHAFEKRLLQMFQLPSPPNPKSSHSSIPKVLKHIYSYQMGEEGGLEIDESLSDKTNIIKHHPEVQNDAMDNNIHYIKFDFDVESHEKLHKTELFLHTEKMANNSIINIYMMNSSSEREKIFSQRVSTGGSIERLDLTSVVDSWHDASKNHGLQIEIENGDVQNFRMRRSADSEFDDSPVLISYIDDGSQSPKLSRSRRRPKKGGSRRMKQRNMLCSRRDLYVDFSRVDWQKWIVAPVGYKAYVCEGICAWPMDDHLNTTNHAIFNSFVYMLDPTETDGACCIPTKLSSLHLLYLDHEDRAVLKAYEDMVVEECGCR